MMAHWEMRWFENMQPAAAVELLNRVRFVTTKEAAIDLLEALASVHEKEFGLTRDRAMHEAKVDVGYLGGYFDSDERDRIERLFGTEHPLFGTVAKNGKPNPIDALRMGIERGQRLRRGEGSG